MTVSYTVLFPSVYGEVLWLPCRRLALRLVLHPAHITEVLKIKKVKNNTNVSTDDICIEWWSFLSFSHSPKMDWRGSLLATFHTSFPHIPPDLFAEENWRTELTRQPAKPTLNRCWNYKCVREPANHRFPDNPKPGRASTVRLELMVAFSARHYQKVIMGTVYGVSR